MQDLKRMIISSLSNFLLVTTSTNLMTSQIFAAQEMEKCYGIVKAGMNDCKTSKQECAGSATVDSQPDSYLLLPKGLCDKIVGGRITSPTEHTNTAKPKS